MDVPRHAEVGGVDDFVGGGVVEDGFSVYTGLVGKGAETSDWVVEGDVDCDGLCDQVFDVLELFQLVSRPHVVTICGYHSRHEPAQRGDSIPLPYA